MTPPDDQSGIWLTAEYRFASVYSCRMPMSSIAAAQALPTPGPATVRLALLRSSFEMFGETRSREKIFPTIRTMAVRIQPPERVAITRQTIRGYKATRKREQVILSDGPIVRDTVHAGGGMRISININPAQQNDFRVLLGGIGYWGQNFGLAWCNRIEQATPNATLCLKPVHTVQTNQRVQTLFTGLATEFRDNQVRWEEVIPNANETSACAIQTTVYIWPLHVIEQRNGGSMMERRSL